LKKIFEASKPIVQSKNLDTTSDVNKFTKPVNREQQTTNATVDPALIATIHSNKGAIDTIRGQITELRRDVDQLRSEVNKHRRISDLSTKTNETRRISKNDIKSHNNNNIGQTVAPGNSSVCILL